MLARWIPARLFAILRVPGQPLCRPDAATSTETSCCRSGDAPSRVGRSADAPCETGNAYSPGAASSRPNFFIR